MRRRGTAEGGTDALLQCARGQQPGRLGHALLAVAPARRERGESGALLGRQAGHDPHALPVALDPPVVRAVFSYARDYHIAKYVACPGTRACYALFLGLGRTFVHWACTVVPASPVTGARRRPCGGCHGPCRARGVPSRGRATIRTPRSA